MGANRKEHHSRRGTAFAVSASAVLVWAQAFPATLTKDNFDVVIERSAPPCVKFAAVEMTNVLSKVFRATIPIAYRAEEGRTAIILGSNAWSRAAGLAPEKLPRDGFEIKVSDNRIFITGADDPKSHPEWLVNTGGYARTELSTLFGVYEFLERYAGCRFYFPGDIGTITPECESLDVPEICFVKSPVFTARSVYLPGDGDGYGLRKADGKYPEKSLNWMRLRMETSRIPCCHGLNSFRYADRFRASHPEYFALLKDRSGGELRRDTDPSRKLAFHYGQLCHSSGVRDVLAKDVRARFARGAKYVDVMPQDGFARCLCPECTATYVRPNDRDWATELVWGKTAELARGLLEDGAAGMLTMMAYSPYRRIPDFEVPTNILVMVAEQGPWQKVRPDAFRKANDEVRGWAEKMGHKVWIWTYPHKYGQSAIPSLPQMTPHAWGEYYKALQPWIFGSFAETESDRWIYNYLNYYMFSRVAWDENADVEAILEEHYRLMFGAAADDMKSFYEILEKTWLDGMQGNVDDTPVGPVARIPPPLVVWREIYSPEMIRRCSDCFVRATRKLDRGSIEFRRVKFIKEQFLDPLRASSRTYLKGISVEDEVRRRTGNRVVNLADRVPDAANYGGRRMPPQDEGALPGVSSAFRLDRDFAYVEWTLDLKPKTAYRVSYFVKAQDLFKRADWNGSFGGATVEFFDGASKIRNPTPFEDGTFDWIHRSFVATTPAKEKMAKRPYVRPWMLHGRGTVWFDGICVEEVKKGEPE